MIEIPFAWTLNMTDNIKLHDHLNYVLLLKKNKKKCGDIAIDRGH